MKIIALAAQKDIVLNCEVSSYEHLFLNSWPSIAPLILKETKSCKAPHYKDFKRQHKRLYDACNDNNFLQIFFTTNYF